MHDDIIFCDGVAPFVDPFASGTDVFATGPDLWRPVALESAQFGPWRGDEPVNWFQPLIPESAWSPPRPAFDPVADAFMLKAGSDGPTPMRLVATAADDEATEVDEVVIISRPRFEQGDSGESGGAGYIHPGSPGGGDDGFGPSDEGAAPNDERPYDACEDRQADTLADEIRQEIADMPDDEYREYGALIWRDDDGNLHRTGLVAGTNSDTPFPADPQALGLDSYSRVVGMVHSHPRYVNLGTAEHPDWVESSHGWVWGGDWESMAGWVSMHNLDVNNLTQYIVFDGSIREYDWRDNNNPDLQNDIDDSGSTESGDFIPGASCP